MAGLPAFPKVSLSCCSSALAELVEVFFELFCAGTLEAALSTTFSGVVCLLLAHPAPIRTNEHANKIIFFICLILIGMGRPRKARSPRDEVLPSSGAPLPGRGTWG